MAYSVEEVGKGKSIAFSIGSTAFSFSDIVSFEHIDEREEFLETSGGSYYKKATLGDKNEAIRVVVRNYKNYDDIPNKVTVTNVVFKANGPVVGDITGGGVGFQHNKEFQVTISNALCRKTPGGNSNTGQASELTLEFVAIQTDAGADPTVFSGMVAAE